MLKNLSLIALDGIPLIAPKDSIPLIIKDAVVNNKLSVNDGDIFVIAQKIISKSENRFVYLNDISPSSEAVNLSLKTQKDPRLVQIILDESIRVVRSRIGVIVVENKIGLVHANAGIDKSNIDSQDSNPKVLLLPINPDSSAKKIKNDLDKIYNCSVGVIINDSSGRAWRNGTTGIAIGSSGALTLSDLRGHKDLYGRPLEITQIGIGDEIASAASILMGQADEGLPVVLIKGLANLETHQKANDLIREPNQDLFR